MNQTKLHTNQDLLAAITSSRMEKMSGTRDKLIHPYFGIDYDIVFDIVKNKIPDLAHFLREVIS